MWKGSLDKTDVEYLAGGFRQGREVFVQALSPSAQAFLAWGLHESIPGAWVWVLESPKALEVMRQDVTALSFEREQHVAYYPARDILPGRGLTNDLDIIGERLNALQHLSNRAGGTILLTCVQALMQITLSPHALSEYSFALSIAGQYDPGDLASRLQTAGYEFTHEVHARGEAALRGGLLDVWPPTALWPVRLEFFGDVLDSIRTFDPTEQTSIGKLSEVRLSPASEEIESGPEDGRTALMDYLPEDTCWAWCEPDALEEHAQLYEQTLQESGISSRHIRYPEAQLRVEKAKSGGNLILSSTNATAYPLSIEPGERVPAFTGPGMHPDVMEKTRRTFIHDLARKAREGSEVHIFFDTTGAMERFVQMYPNEAAPQLMELHVAPLSEGFSYPPYGLIVAAESDLYGYQKMRLRHTEKEKVRRAGKYSVSHALASWTDIQPGDLVVHVEHGVGKYLGLYEIDFHGQKQEVLAVEYANDAKLYVPASQTHLLSRYIGVGRTRPNLHTLGTARWARQKEAAAEAIEDLAATLLETQASRETLAGHAFPPDTVWQHEFEASFPYQETADQHRAIREVKEDMESAKPMDRLICGDVGYGKTEVAMRAAFKAVMDGRQVAVLVPTTVLAQQHYYTFSERMSSFPVTVEMLSRFRTHKEQNEVIRGLREGSVDIVIGTHRLVQGDITFRDLGLVIIDEEQRFGVAHKEVLKQLRQLVDVLTMTATPIPRTLYMSLTGAKDMSTIQTPPQERLPIDTIVMEYDEQKVRQAILHELNRDGQVFYLHNRVKTIHKVQEILAKLVPEARIGVAHGQMSERTLASIMRRFVQGDIDVLLCTTIIESGVDIPNVNTIIIDRADRFGMADLYQLRGRVGRYKHKAYAYLLLPKHGRLFDSARKRISAIKRYSSLGAGFKLALRDLEIRGAGNLLGAQQSGHIAAVGFDLYCQLLRHAVAQKKGETLPPVIHTELNLDFIDLSPQHAEETDSAAIPYSYVEDENQRLQAYRRLASSSSPEDIDQLEADLRDRFGPLPEAVLRLMNCARIRIFAAAAHIQAVEVRENKLMMTRDNDYLMRDRRFPRLTSESASQKLKEIIRAVREWD